MFFIKSMLCLFLLNKCMNGFSDCNCYDMNMKLTCYRREVTEEGDGNSLFDQTGKDDNDIYNDIYKMIDLDKVDKELKANGYNEEINLSYMVSCISTGDTKTMWQYVRSRVRYVFLGEIVKNRQLMLSMIMVVLLGSVFTKLSASFLNSSISENGFYITYLMITSIVLGSFIICLEVVSQTLSKLIVLIRIIVPVFMVAMNFVGHAFSAVSAYQLVMIAIWIVEVVLLRLLIPLAKYYVIIALINNLSKEMYFSKLVKFMEKLFDNILKTAVLFVMGLNLVKGLIGPQLDLMGKASVNRLISTMMGGGIASVLTGTFFAAGMVVKNAIGIGFALIILFFVMAPIIKLLAVKLFVRLTAIVVEPVGDKRYIDGIDVLANGIGMLVRVIYSATVLFLLIIAIMAFSTNSGVMS